MNIYKIDHFYNKKRDEGAYAIVVESSINPENMAKIAGCIQLMFEERQDEHDCIDENHLLKLLVKYYGAKDVKEEYREVLPQTALPDEKWEMIVEIVVQRQGKKVQVYQIDMYEAREYANAYLYAQMSNYLPVDENFIVDLLNCEDFYEVCAEK